MASLRIPNWESMLLVLVALSACIPGLFAGWQCTQSLAVLSALIYEGVPMPPGTTSLCYSEGDPSDRSLLKGVRTLQPTCALRLFFGLLVSQPKACRTLHFPRTAQRRSWAASVVCCLLAACMCARVTVYCSLVLFLI